MADPKYASLPGIDRDQPDVFETSDLPEDDQAQLAGPEESTNEAIEQTNVNVGEAYKKFRGKVLDTSRADFSDKIGRYRRTGYDVNKTEYEIIGDGVPQRETPEQKFQRLQHEIKELADEISQVQANLKAEADKEKLSSVGMSKQVEYLQHQLTDLHMDKLLGTQGGLDLADPQGALQKRLITEIEAFKSPAEKPGSQKVAPSVENEAVVYQLYYRPEQAKFSNNAKIADLEQRLERLEAVIGQNPEKLSMITAETNNKSLLGAVASMSSKMTLLDPSQLEQMEGRLLALGHKLGQIKEKKEQVEDADKQNKISELYELVKKWDSIADTLPHVVDRLEALQDLHHQALQFSQALSHLDTAQQVIQTQLQAHGDMLSNVQKTLTANMDTVKNNCKSLEERMKVLPKK